MAEETPNTPAPTEEPAAAAAPVAAETVVLATKPEPAKSFPVPPLPEGVHYIWGTGRRKTAVARVRIRPGTGKILVNKRERDHYFPDIRDRNQVMVPLVKTNLASSIDIWVNVNGGGYSGQAGAIALGISRALCRAVPDCESILRDNGLMTRDARMKERKKYGQKGARKRFQFSKR